MVRPGNEPERNERRDPMMLRRLGLIAPLAVLVAVLVHLALFGKQHAPGAEHAGRLFSTLGAALALAALASVLFAALGLQRRCRRERRIASAHRVSFPLELAAGGTLAFALIELAEGHSPFACGAWQFAATAAAAYAVAVVARYAARLLARTGDALAAFSSTSHVPVVFTFIRAWRFARACGAARPNACRGRAPPLFS